MRAIEFIGPRSIRLRDDVPVPAQQRNPSRAECLRERFAEFDIFDEQIRIAGDILRVK